ncbi:MAG: M28 family peptidase [Verrucomicrobiota bacterium]
MLLLVGCGSQTPPLAFEDLDRLVSGEEAYSETLRVVRTGVRAPGSVASAAAREAIATRLGELGWTTIEQPFDGETPRGVVKFTNLRARFGGSPDVDWDQQKSVLFATRYDVRSYRGFDHVGANAGASGAGVVIELARVLAVDSSRAGKVELVFFDGYSPQGSALSPRDGLKGSRHYAEQIISGTMPSPARAGVWIDQVGERGLDWTLRSQLPSDAIESLTSDATRPYPVDLKAVESALIDSVQQFLTGADEMEIRGRISSAAEPVEGDAMPLNLVAGIPTLSLFDGDYPYRLTPGDTIDRVKPQSLELTARLLLRWLEKQ